MCSWCFPHEGACIRTGGLTNCQAVDRPPTLLINKFHAFLSVMNKKQEIDVFSFCLVFMYHREELYMAIAGYHIGFVGQSKRTVE